MRQDPSEKPSFFAYPFQAVKRFFKDLTTFIREVANDPRIPERDKKVVLALLVLVLSPIDIIPDWIPVLGQLDDLVMIAIILDYFFDVLDAEILLSHYPWGMRSFLVFKRSALMIAYLTPRWVKRRIWKYSGNPYQAK